KPVTEFHWDDEAESPIASVSPATDGGVKIVARSAGDGSVTVIIDGKPATVNVQITSEVAVPRSPRVFKPGWQPWSTTILPGGYDDTPKYDQLENDNWCPLVGCGPNALAMLTAWYDRHG